MENPESLDYNLFLLGSGFTRAVFPDAPLNKDLLQTVIKSSPKSHLMKYQKQYNTNDVEVLLTRLDLEAHNNQEIEVDRKAIERDLVEYFQQFRFKKEILQNNSWLESIAKELFKKNDAIITLNYDCFLEGLLDYYEVWSPNGYAAIDTFFSKQLPQNPKNILIYKIHGSEHFIISSAYPDPSKRAISFDVNSSIYPQSGNRRCYDGGIINPESYIIAPSFVKIPNECIEWMMIEALNKAATAKNLIIIGCGLRPEDSFLWLLVTNFLYQRKMGRRLIIVDLQAKEIKAKISNHYFEDIEEFSVKAILFTNGLASDCDRLIKCLDNLRKEEVN